MEKSYELKYHRLEENSWWFLSRREMLLQIIDSYNLKKDAKILEIGCSGGPLMQALRKRGYTNVHGIDISSAAITLCKKRRIQNAYKMDAAKTTFKDSQFDLLIASDVLEHIKSDSSALKEWKRIMKPRGKLIIFVPAFQFLWTSHDEVNYHFRRYNASLLKMMIKKNNMRILKNSYWNFMLFFPIFIMRTIKNLFGDKHKKPKDQVYEVNSIANKFLISILRIENWLLKFIRFPVGVSVYVECEKQ